MEKEHHYSIHVQWTGNKGTGTASSRGYDRNHLVAADNKPPIPCSSDPAFLGDTQRYNPEELLVASISSCHMLWYLHLCSQAGVTVLAYDDHAKGTMQETLDGSGHFLEVSLHPMITLKDPSMEVKAHVLHDRAGKLCFIANSVNFPIHHFPSYQFG